MNESHEQILSKARHFVTDLFTHQVKPQFVFHNLDHTEGVADAASQMADYYRLNDDDTFILMMAAWFHDTGYSSGRPEGHEDVSVQIATKFLHENNVEDNHIQRIDSAIQATRMPQSPISQVEKILCDADLAHLATPDFKAMSQLLKQERENILGKKIQKKEWRQGNINFLENHKYYTEYGQEFMEPKKNDNLLSLKKKTQDKDDIKEIKEDPFPYKSNIPQRRQRKLPKKAQSVAYKPCSGSYLEITFA